MTSGLASASLCWISRPFLYDGQRSPGLPVSFNTMPMLLWLCARSSWNCVTSGLASASLCWIARPAWYDARASSDCRLAQQEADVVVAIRKVTLELGDARAGAGQALQKCSSLLVQTPRLVHLPGLPQHIAQIKQAAADFSLRIADGSCPFGQAPPYSQRLTMARDRLISRADLGRQLGHLGVRLSQSPPRCPVGLARELGFEGVCRTRWRP